MRPIPETAHAIDADWLTEALSERHPGVRVAEVEVVERREGTNSHAQLRIRYDEPAGAPEPMFCKLLPSEPGRRAAIAATGMGARETLFYSRLAPSIAMRVPAVYVACHDERDGSFALLIEDLLATGCTVSDGTVGVTADAAAVALEDLADLHLRFADPARRRVEAAWVPPPLHDPSYASAMFRHGLAHHRDRLGLAYAAIAQMYLDDADALHALWQEGPTTVIHGDPHIGNLFDDAGRVGFLDWGILSTGTPIRDVSYFLTMAMDIDERRAHERALLRHYLAVSSARGGAELDFDAVWRAHRIHAAYTVVASSPILAYPETRSAPQRVFSRAFLARAEAAVEDLESVAALRECGIGE
jgi:aminoglycoside phosphotransferase (APT) family kinase protein